MADRATGLSQIRIPACFKDIAKKKTLLQTVNKLEVDISISPIQQPKHAVLRERARTHTRRANVAEGFYIAH